MILNRAFSVTEGYIQFTIVPHEDGTVTIHLRDNAREFNPFELNTDEISLEEGTGLDAIGVKMIKSKAKEFSTAGTPGSTPWWSGCDPAQLRGGRTV